LWRNADFRRLWVGKTISDLGSGIGGTALPLTAVLVLSATPAQMGALAAIGAAPVLLVGLPAGAWVDRLPRRPILIVTDLGRALLLATVPLAAALGTLHMTQLYAVAALVGMLTVFFQVADQSFLPAVVAREDLVEANSALGVSASLAEIGGPSLGGVLVQVLSAPTAILCDVTSFLASALCIGGIRAPDPAAPAVERRHMRREIGEGLRLVLRDPLLRALAASSATFTFFGSFIGALYNLFVIRELGLSSAVLGALIGAGGIGALIGATLMGPIVRRVGIGPAVSVALLVAAPFALVIPLVGGPPPVAAALLLASQVLGDVAIAIYLIGEVTLRQSLIPERYLGRATASMQVLTQGSAPIGALIAGTLGSAIGMRPTLLIGVLGIAASSAWLLASPVRRLREPIPQDIQVRM
jgi:MFS family permease